SKRPAPPGSARTRAWAWSAGGSGVVHKPPAGVVGDVGGTVVQHQAHVQPSRDPGVQVIEEGDEVGRGVAVDVGGLHDPAAVDVQGGQQDRGAVADVLVLLAGRGAGGGAGGGRGGARGRRAP